MIDYGTFKRAEALLSLAETVEEKEKKGQKSSD